MQIFDKNFEWKHHLCIGSTTWIEHCFNDTDSVLSLRKQHNGQPIFVRRFSYRVVTWQKSFIWIIAVWFTWQSIADEILWSQMMIVISAIAVASKEFHEKKGESTIVAVVVRSIEVSSKGDGCPQRKFLIEQSLTRILLSWCTFLAAWILQKSE